MGSRAGSPGSSKKRSAHFNTVRPSVKHMRNESLTSEAASRLMQSTAAPQDMPSPAPSAGRSVSGRAKASTTGELKDMDLDLDSSDIDEADFGAETFVTYQETAAEKARMKLLLDSFNEDQMARYEVFRRVTLNKINVKKLANSILAQSLPQNIAVVIAGSGKVFVGEIVERARQIQSIRGQHGSLEPEHLREAYRLYKLESRRQKLFH